MTPSMGDSVARSRSQETLTRLFLWRRDACSSDFTRNFPKTLDVPNCLLIFLDIGDTIGECGLGSASPVAWRASSKGNQESYRDVFEETCSKEHGGVSGRAWRTPGKLGELRRTQAKTTGVKASNYGWE
jgi:hypothetical protein